MRGAAKYLLKEIFVRQRYRRPGFEIRTDDTVVDIGANMGLFVLWAAPQAPDGRVLAVEPMSVIETLDLNVRLNGLENVTSLQAAAGNDGDTMEFIEYPGFNLVTHQIGVRPALVTRFLIGLLFFRYKQDPVRTRSQCVSLGRIMDEFDLETINLLKIDCEGGEYDIFAGVSPAQWQRIERISMEFHELQPDHKHEKLVACLEQQGFRVEVRKPFFEYYFMKFGQLWAWRP
jgi:FkbM family methyltransferase